MNTDNLDKVISKAAVSASRDWPGVIEADDMHQEIWVRLLESPKAMDSIDGADEGVQVDLLKRMGVQIASKYAADYELFSGNVYYGTENVRALLESGMLTVSRRELADMKETLTDFIDLHNAFDHMKEASPGYAEAIWTNYVDGLIPDNGARERKLRRAVLALTDRMNQSNRRRHAEHEDGLGTREIISNARVRAISSTQWDGPRVR